MASPQHSPSTIVQPSPCKEGNKTPMAASSNSGSSLEYFEEHGFFCQAMAAIGGLIENSYTEGRAKEVEFDLFEDSLRSNESLKELLDSYPETLPFKHLWGTVPKHYYSWDNPPTKITHVMLIYLLGPTSEFSCRDGSHNRNFKIEQVNDDRTLHLPDELLEPWKPLKFVMPEGGV
ncbi:hypothetical protein FOFC_18419 [Fusarium oxysporum]|nr:hypothetical protein FOFC_18419 [Fusarium oxysporum]